MTADAFNTPNERMLSGALALVTHALFFLLLLFGVSWQKRQNEPMVVDLWNNLPSLAAPKAEPAPQPKPEPEPAKPEPKVERKPAPKPEPKPILKAEPKPAVKPDIALKDKKEKERKAAEQALAEKKKREQEQLAALKERQAKERAAREQEEALRKLAQQQATAQAKLIDEYKRRIAEKIKRFILEPPNLQGNPEVELDVFVLPGGEVLDVKTKRASGQTAWDNAVERAIRKAQPLPLPPDPALLKDFRELNLKFRPKE